MLQIMERKLILFGHIRRMDKTRLINIKQVVFGKIKAHELEVQQTKNGLMMSRSGANWMCTKAEESGGARANRVEKDSKASERVPTTCDQQMDRKKES